MKGPFESKPVVAALVVPGIAVMVFSMLVPLLFSAYFSLTDWAGFGAFKFVGLENYVEILTADPVFWRSLWNTFLLMVVTIVVQNPLAFALAAVLAHVSQKLSRFLRTIYFVPAVLSLVIIAKMWVNLMNPTYGLVNKVLAAVGLKALAISWLSNPHTAIWAVIFIIVWQGFGWALLFYYAGLMTVPREIEEAARVDGASWLQTYLLVIVPYLYPAIAAVIVIDVISSMKQMELIFLSTGGGPGQLTQFVSVYLYQKAFVSGEYGYGNALSVLFVAISVGLTLLVQRLMRTAPDES
ncbi:MAG TPA: sugar ABC transporter permease [Anaeromyxobacter sp.]|nr:sugar ABC transporter permease [Anaeromyxobacter sp.]HVO20985.1 sugar ABC transporter permease [Anaeromyxobacter sp.]